MRRHILDLGRPATTVDVLIDSGSNGLTSDPAMSDVGVTLRRLRVRARQTQEELAALAKVGQKTISQIETGRRQAPSPIVIGNGHEVVVQGEPRQAPEVLMSVSLTVARGIVRCAVVTEEPLPPAAYPIVGELKEEVDKFAVRLSEIVRSGTT